MYWDRWDIVEAWYLALSDCHGGQYSDTYARLCRMQEYFRPSPFLSVESLSENGREIYEAACERLLAGR
jgi:hypothetical protein